MLPFNKQFIFATRPMRYAFNSFTYRRFADPSSIDALKDRYKGKPMLVVGNGPSLNQTPLDDFARVPSIGMNKIDMIYSRTTWRPELVLCVNDLVAIQHQSIYAASDIQVFVGWKVRWFLSRETRDKINFFNTLNSNAFSKDAVEGFGSSATVTYIALQMAYWMGADPVIIFGVDHSFNYAGPTQTYQKREGPDTNHFDPNYFKIGTYWGTPDLDQCELDYGLARKAFEEDGRKVYDATVGGKLTVFEKVGLEKALAYTRG